MDSPKIADGLYCFLVDGEYQSSVVKDLWLAS